MRLAAVVAGPSLGFIFVVCACFGGLRLLMYICGLRLLTYDLVPEQRTGPALQQPSCTAATCRATSLRTAPTATRPCAVQPKLSLLMICLAFFKIYDSLT